MKPDELRALVAGNPLASYLLLLDRKLTLARLAEESANHRANVAKEERDHIMHQCNGYELVLARISDALDGVRYEGSPAHKILALRAELDAAHSDLAALEIVGYTTQGQIDATRTSALQHGEFYALPDNDDPVELLRRAI